MSARDRIIALLRTHPDGPGNVLAKEPPDAKEFAGLVCSGLARLKDAEREANSLDSRFDLAQRGSPTLPGGAPAPRIPAIETVHRLSSAAGRAWPWPRGLASPIEMSRHAKSDR